MNKYLFSILHAEQSKTRLERITAKSKTLIGWKVFRVNSETPELVKTIQEAKVIDKPENIKLIKAVFAYSA